jgi:hypothetical protein
MNKIYAYKFMDLTSPDQMKINIEEKFKRSIANAQYVFPRSPSTSVPLRRSGTVEPRKVLLTASRIHGT